MTALVALPVHTYLTPPAAAAAALAGHGGGGSRTLRWRRGRQLRRVVCGG